MILYAQIALIIVGVTTMFACGWLANNLTQAIKSLTDDKYMAYAPWTLAMGATMGATLMALGAILN